MTEPHHQRSKSSSNTNMTLVWQPPIFVDSTPRRASTGTVDVSPSPPPDHTSSGGGKMKTKNNSKPLQIKFVNTPTTSPAPLSPTTARRHSTASPELNSSKSRAQRISYRRRIFSNPELLGYRGDGDASPVNSPPGSPSSPRSPRSPRSPYTVPASPTLSQRSDTESPLQGIVLDESESAYDDMNSLFDVVQSGNPNPLPPLAERDLPSSFYHSDVPQPKSLVSYSLQPQETTFLPISDQSEPHNALPSRLVHQQSYSSSPDQSMSAPHPVLPHNPGSSPAILVHSPHGSSTPTTPPSKPFSHHTPPSYNPSHPNNKNMSPSGASTSIKSPLHASPLKPSHTQSPLSQGYKPTSPNESSSGPPTPNPPSAPSPSVQALSASLASNISLYTSNKNHLEQLQQQLGEYTSELQACQNPSLTVQSQYQQNPGLLALEQQRQLLLLQNIHAIQQTLFTETQKFEELTRTIQAQKQVLAAHKQQQQPHGKRRSKGMGRSQLSDPNLLGLISAWDQLMHIGSELMIMQDQKASTAAPVSMFVNEPSPGAVEAEIIREIQSVSALIGNLEDCVDDEPEDDLKYLDIAEGDLDFREFKVKLSSLPPLPGQIDRTNGSNLDDLSFNSFGNKSTEQLFADLSQPGVDDLSLFDSDLLSADALFLAEPSFNNSNPEIMSNMGSNSNSSSNYIPFDRFLSDPVSPHFHRIYQQQPQQHQHPMHQYSSQQQQQQLQYQQQQLQYQQQQLRPGVLPNTRPPPFHHAQGHHHHTPSHSQHQHLQQAPPSQFSPPPRSSLRNDSPQPSSASSSRRNSLNFTPPPLNQFMNARSNSMPTTGPTLYSNGPTPSFNNANHPPSPQRSRTNLSQASSISPNKQSYV